MPTFIEIALCESCGADWPWRSAGRSKHGLPGCMTCGSDRVSRAERQETPAEIERLVQSLRERKG